MRLRKVHIIGIIFALIVLIVNIIFFRGENLFYFLVGICFVVAALPFIMSLVIERNVEKEKNDMFLEFSRNLSESVKTGTPVGRSILNMRNKNFGSLSPHINKLANQISMGIPISQALQNFSNDINTNAIKRAVVLIKEAENAGGNIENILDSVAKSIYQIEKLKKERMAAIYNLVVQGYIIFFIFIGIMLVMQFKILPLTSDLGSLNDVKGFGSGFGAVDVEEFTNPFLYLLIAQGIFAGLVIGKLAEGSIKSGIKHSFILAIVTFLVSAGANAFL